MLCCCIVITNTVITNVICSYQSITGVSCSITCISNVNYSYVVQRKHTKFVIAFLSILEYNTVAGSLNFDSNASLQVSF